MAPLGRSLRSSLLAATSFAAVLAAPGRAGAADLAAAGTQPEPSSTTTIVPAPTQLATTEPTPPTQTQPSQILDSTKHSDMIILTVDKTSLKAELKTLPEDASKSATLRSFRIAIGKGGDGDKQHEGDNKTPEGIYFAQSHIDGGQLPEKYGKMAIPIDFPNPMDVIEGKTGHGIWLHGVDREGRVDEAKVTEGCVAFYNADIARLGTWLLSHQGVVVIAHDPTTVNSPADVAAVREKTLGWMTAWADRRIEDYIALYSPDFRFQRYSRDTYKAYKKRVFGMYDAMDVKFDGLRVITHEKYAISLFNQDFHGDKSYESIGRKILYWERAEGGEWRIKREVFENRRFESVTFTDAELALLSEPTSSISSDKDKKAPNL
jgi:murein L,D-transpeptidase YafK